MLPFLLWLTKQGIVLGVVFAIQKIFSRKRNENSYIAFSLFVATSIVLWGVVTTGTGYARTNGFSTILYLPALFAIGPLYYFYYRLLLQPASVQGKRALRHFTPAMLVLTGEFLTRVIAGQQFQGFLVQLFENPMRHLLTPLIIGGCLHMLGYFLYLLWVIIHISNKKVEIRLFTRIGIGANIMAVSALTMICSGFLSWNMTLYFGGGALIALIHLGLLLASVRYPYFFQILAKELKKEGYEKPLLKGIDVESSLGRVEKLMREEKPYLEGDFSIKSLASTVNLTTGQVSQLLNDKLDIDFRNYTNQFRIEHAQQLFKEDPESNILSVCYQSGFHSKSAFNEAFKKFTGLTPSEFKAGSKKKRKG